MIQAAPTIWARLRVWLTLPRSLATCLTACSLSGAGPHGFARREMNRAAIRGRLRLATSNDQVDALFEARS
jgi:hypothetical protein